MNWKLLFAGALFFFISFTIQAQSSIVERQLLQMGVVLAADGYQITHQVRYFSLNEGYYDNYYFSLNRGWTYQIVGACDGDCGDLDFCLFDENGNEIDCDETTDDKPIVQVTPKWTGRFRLWVKMYDCDINPCRFGIVVFGK